MSCALRWVAVSSMAFGLLGCPAKKQAPNAGADAQAAADAQAEAAASVTAANESEVTRYPDETPIAGVPATTRWTVSDARTQASRTTGTLVAALKSGTDVQKLAERQGFFLIMFPDPKNPGRMEEGWVSEGVFTPEPPHKHAPAKCAAGQVAVLLQLGQEQCVTECTGDSGCPSGEACSGAGPISKEGAPGGIVSFCRGPGKAAAAGDAGAAAAQDAGTKPARPLDVAPGAGGACPPAYGKCNAGCRLTCKADADCGLATAHCQGGFCLQPGAAPCANGGK